MAEDETFQSQDSGAADSYPIEAGQIRKGGYIMIKGTPCKVSDVTSSKTGKHGHAKCLSYGVCMSPKTRPALEQGRWCE